MSDQPRQSGVAIAKIEVIEIGCRERRVVTRGAPDLDQLVRSLYARQRCEQNRLYPGENCSVRSDAQSQGHHDREGKARPFQEHSDAVPEILPEVFHRLSWARDVHWARTIIDLNAHLK